MRAGWGNGEESFYYANKGRGNSHNDPKYRNRRDGGGGSTTVVTPPGFSGGTSMGLDDSRIQNQVTPREISKSNLQRFLESTKPSVPGQFLPKTVMKAMTGSCDGVGRPFFVLQDLWDIFEEWSFYGLGVPLLLNERDSVVQYYVPYLSAIQLYVESKQSPSNARFREDSDGDCSKDSSSDASSDCELEKGQKYSSDWKQHYASSDSTLRMGIPSMKDKHANSLEGFLSDDNEAGNSQARPLFEFFERDPPYCRVPLADKISNLASHFPELRNLRSCDLSPASWVSVAWYPIYRIPTGPILRELDACFLTFHSLSTPMEDTSVLPGPTFTHPHHPHGRESVPKIALPVFGLASYKLKGSIWTPNGGCEKQHAHSLLQAVDRWLRLRHVYHPDYQFFASRSTQYR